MDARPLLAAGLVALAVLPAGEASARSGLRAFANCDQLVSYARARAASAPNLVNATRPVPVHAGTGPMPSPSAAPTSAGTEAAEPDFSGTNVQETGIDEPD